GAPLRPELVRLGEPRGFWQASGDSGLEHGRVPAGKGRAVNSDVRRYATSCLPNALPTARRRIIADQRRNVSSSRQAGRIPPVEPVVAMQQPLTTQGAEHAVARKRQRSGEV